MRLTVVALAAVLTAPAFPQAAPQRTPPEGFYRNIDGAYDLLFRPSAYSDIQLVKSRRLVQLSRQNSRPVTDWTGPVIGVDAPLPVPEESVSVPVDLLKHLVA